MFFDFNIHIESYFIFSFFLIFSHLVDMFCSHLSSTWQSLYLICTVISWLRVQNIICKTMTISSWLSFVVVLNLFCYNLYSPICEKETGLFCDIPLSNPWYPLSAGWPHSSLHNISSCFCSQLTQHAAAHCFLLLGLYVSQSRIAPHNWPQHVDFLDHDRFMLRV